MATRPITGATATCGRADCGDAAGDHFRRRDGTRGECSACANCDRDRRSGGYLTASCPGFTPCGCPEYVEV